MLELNKSNKEAAIKTPVYIFIFCALFLTLAFLPTALHAQEASAPTETTAPTAQGSSFFDSWGVQLGYAIGELKAVNDGELEITLLLTRLTRSINSLFGLENHKGTINFVLEPFIGHIISPDNDVTFGALLTMEYVFPLTEKFLVHGGFGGGPSYFGVDTFEQGEGGFEFFDTGIAGGRYQFNPNEALHLEYRAVHISNLGLMDDNHGINGHALTLGYSKKF